MSFIPEQPKGVKDVPYFDDVTRDGGWQGHGTGKSVKKLKAEIMEVVTRLGGMVISFPRGTFSIGGQEREGFQVHYSIEAPNGDLIPGRIDIAALPVKRNQRQQRSFNTRKDKSLRMALYMLRSALDGTWFLQQLSPGYAPLMPWMLGSDDKTISQLWADSSIMSHLLPEPSEEFVEGEVTE